MKKSEALKILGLTDGASDEDIKKAHRAKVRANHPDQFSDPAKKKSAEEKTKLINEARDVLVQRKWDPEYGPRTGGYGNPYTNPYTSYRPHGTSGTGTGGQGQNPYNQDDPFAGYGFPFDYVWTSWDGSSTQRGQQAEGNPFDPFSSVFTQPPQKSAQEEADEAKRELNFTMACVGTCLAILAVCALLGSLAMGMYIFILASILFLMYRQMPSCGGAIIIPFIIIITPVAMMFRPTQIGNMPDLGTIIAFAIAAIYNISTFRESLSKYNTAKERANVAQ